MGGGTVPGGRQALGSLSPLQDSGHLDVGTSLEEGSGVGYGYMMEGCPPARLLLHLPKEAAGVCDGLEFVTGGTARQAAVLLSGVILCASSAALELGGAGTAPCQLRWRCLQRRGREQ